MLKKVALLAALLVAMVALARATAYTTTIVTTEIDEEANQGQTRECRRQLQGRPYRSCQRYISQRREPYGYGEEEENVEEVIEMKTGETNQGQQERYNLRQCCEQLRNVNPDCRCEAIRYAVRQLQQHEGFPEEEEMEQVYRRARDLPRRCNFDRPQQCRFRAVLL